VTTLGSVGGIERFESEASEAAPIGTVTTTCPVIATGNLKWVDDCSHWTHPIENRHPQRVRPTSWSRGRSKIMRSDGLLGVVVVIPKPCQMRPVTVSRQTVEDRISCKQRGCAAFRYPGFFSLFMNIS
jgi:hypothetical protein